MPRFSSPRKGATCELLTCMTRWPLAHPVSDARRSWSERDTVLLELRLGSTHGLGEATPLPGRSAESARACEAALQALSVRPIVEVSERLARSHVEPHFTEALKEATPASLRDLPAARYALQTALLDLWAKLASKPAHELLSGRSNSARLPLCTLLDLSPTATLLQRAHSQYRAGYRCFKIKLGKESLFDELKLLTLLRDSFGPKLAMRLDVNQAWSKDQANQGLRALSSLKLEFVEEPVVAALWRNLSATDTPLAFDESLSERPLSALMADCRHLNVTAVVVKPMLLGGIDRTYELVQTAERLGLEVVLSHVHDGSIAWASYAALSLAWGSRKLAAGLAPHAVLRDSSTALSALAGTHIVGSSRPGLGIPGDVPSAPRGHTA